MLQVRYEVPEGDGDEGAGDAGDETSDRGERELLAPRRVSGLGGHGVLPFAS